MASSARHNLVRKLGEGLKRHKEGVCLLVLLSALFLLYNFTNLAGPNWFTHPDDAGTWITSRHYVDTGQLVSTEKLYQEFEYPVFTPPSHIDTDGKVVPVKAPGEYIFLAPGHLLGEGGFFWIVPIFAVLGLVFLYLLSKTLFDTKAAFFTVILFGFSFPAIYWSNMAFSNIPALSLFIGGFYYLTKIIKGESKKFSNYILSSIFFASAVWLRYEYLMFILLALIPIILVYRFKVIHNLKYFALALILFLILLCPILSLLNAFYGSPFTIGYVVETEPSTPGLDTGAGTGESPVGQVITGASEIFERFMMQDLHPNFHRILNNAKDWLLVIYPVPLILGIAGIIHTFKNREQKNMRILHVSLLLILLLWTYDTLGGYHWGEGQPWWGSAYTRYLLITYAILSLYAGGILSYSFRALSRKKPHLIRHICICLLIFQLAVLTPFFLFIGQFSLYGTTQQKQDFHALDSFVKQLPEESVIVSGFYSKVIVSRPVLNPLFIPDEENRQQITAEYIEKLLETNHSIYIIEAEWHESTYFALASFISTNCPQLKVELFSEITHRGDVYQVTKI